MEHQFDGVEVWRVLRQVSQFCSAGLDSLLHAGDLVEGNVVDDDDVPPSKSRSQTLFDISEECVSVHGSLDYHRGYDTGSTKACNECQRFPAPHRNLADKAFSAWAPTVGTDHVGGETAVSSINTRQAGSSSPCSRIQRRRFRATTTRI